MSTYPVFLNYPLMSEWCLWEMKVAHVHLSIYFPEPVKQTFRIKHLLNFTVKTCKVSQQSTTLTMIFHLYFVFTYTCGMVWSYRKVCSLFIILTFIMEDALEKSQFKINSSWFVKKNPKEHHKQPHQNRSIICLKSP